MTEHKRTGREGRRGAQPDPLLGRVIDGRFRVDAPIARGGMGKVYRATQVPLGREIALKVLHPTYSGDQDPEFHKRFFREASIASKLTHPHTVTIFDYGRTDDDVYYIAMELLEGVTLRQAIRREAPFPAARALHVARQVCRSLREAHAMGVIHRDLKPANVFLLQTGDEPDYVKVLDFGLVKDMADQDEDLTETGLFMGSPKYMPPEQIRGDAVDARADLYSLGVILFEMLTGAVPFDRSSSMHTLMAHVHDAAPAMRDANPAAEVTPLLEEIVQGCLAKRPDDRFSGMDDLLVALKHASGDFLSQEGHLSGDSGFGTLPPSLRTSQASAAFRRRPEAPAPPRGSLPPRPAAAPAAARSSLPPPPVVPVDDVPPSTAPPVVRLETPSAGPPPDREPTGRHAAATGEVTRVPRQAPPSAAAAPPPRRSWGPVVVGLLVLAAGAAAALVFLGARPAPPPKTAAPTPAPTPPSIDPPPRPSVPPTTRVELRTDPPGATVTVAGRDRGVTPLSLELPTEPGRERPVTFALDGYLPHTERHVFAGAPLELVAELTPAPARDDLAREEGGDDADVDEAPTRRRRRRTERDVAEEVRARIEQAVDEAPAPRPHRGASPPPRPEPTPDGYKADPY